MTEIRISVNDMAAREFFNRADAEFEINIRTFLQGFGRRLRDLTQAQIRSQGVRLRSRWAPASKWIRAKKGRDQVLLEAIPHIHYRTTRNNLLQVFFRSPGNWTLTQHQQGFTIPADRAYHTIFLRRPEALSTNQPKFRFRWNKASVVPPRKIWPNPNEQWREARPLLEAWLRRVYPGAKP